MSRHAQYECYALAPNAFICSCHFINTVGTGAKRASLSFSSAVQLVFLCCVPSLQQSRRLALLAVNPRLLQLRSRPLQSRPR